LSPLLLHSPVPSLPISGPRPPVPTLEGVLLDVGHTLIRPSRPVEDVILQVLIEEGHDNISMSDLKRGMVRGARFLARMYGRDNSIWVSEEAVRTFWFQFYALILSNAGLAEDQIAHVAPLAYERFQQPAAWTVFPDVWPALETLQQKGLALGVISDWGEGLTDLLHGLGLSKYFDFVVSSAVVGIAKPNPTVFALALARGGLIAERTIYIGDAYPLDVIGARAAGVTPVLILREGEVPSLDCPAIRNLPAILDML